MGLSIVVVLLRKTKHHAERDDHYENRQSSHAIMERTSITDPGQVYDIADRLAKACLRYGRTGIAEQLDDALHAGSSSALETLGEIHIILVKNITVLEQVEDRSVLDETIYYIDQMFGRIDR